MSKESKAVVKTETQAMTVSDVMADMGVSSRDMLIPRLMLMQNTSEYVGDDKAKMGDVVNSQTLEVLGDTSKPVEVIPLRVYKTWKVYDLRGSVPKKLREEPMTADNEKKDAMGTIMEGEVPTKHYYCINAMVLVASDIAKGEAFPTVVTFKSTSLMAGKQLVSFIVRQAAFRKNPFDNVVTLGVTKQKKESNTYAVFNAVKGRETTPAEREEAIRWISDLKNMVVKVDDADDHEEVAPAAVAPTVVSSTPGDQF